MNAGARNRINLIMITIAVVVIRMFHIYLTYIPFASIENDEENIALSATNNDAVTTSTITIVEKPASPNPANTSSINKDNNSTTFINENN